MAPFRLGLVTLAVLAAGAATASAQDTGPPYEATRANRVTAGVEFAGILGPPDDIAFFNYTDYGSNTLRTARLRLLGEWRPGTRLSFVGEVRVENAAEEDLAALYVRWQPFASLPVEVRAGRIPPLFGAFPRRAYGRDNIVLGTPLAYQYVTSLRSDALPASVDDLLRMRGRGWQPSYPIGSTALEPGVPLVSTALWDTGVQATWRHGRFDLGVAATQGAPSVPVVDDRSRGWQWSGRAGMTTAAGLTIGASVAHGAWVDDDVAALASAPGIDARGQTVFGVDAEYGRGPLLVRGEWLRSQHEMPMSAQATGTLSLGSQSGFVEARYRIRPRWDISARVERLTFSSVTGSSGEPVSWDAPVDRVEVILGFRVSRHIDLRGGYQYDWRPAGRVHERGYPVLALLLWF